MHTIELEGNGSPLLFLHGWGQSNEVLTPLAELLNPIAKPYLIDLPGFGKSKIPEQVWSAYDYADSIVRYLDMQRIDKFSLLGHSFGGKVSMCLALRYPERVEKLILIAPSGIPPKRTLSKRLKIKSIVLVGKALKGVDRILQTNYFRDKFSPRFASIDYQNAGKMRPILVKSVNEDLTPVLPQIKCKTLILWGENDIETPLESGKRLSKLIPLSTFYSFPYHDHQLFRDGGAHLCATYISPFLLEGDNV